MTLLGEKLLSNCGIDGISNLVSGQVNSYIAGENIKSGDLVKFSNDREHVNSPKGIFNTSGGTIATANNPREGNMFLLEETSTYTKVLSQDGAYIQILKIDMFGNVETLATSSALSYPLGKIVKLDSLRYLYVGVIGTSNFMYTVINLNAEYTTITMAAQAILITVTSASYTPISLCLVDTDKVLFGYEGGSNYFYIAAITVSGNTATINTPLSLATVAAEINMVKVANNVAFAVFASDSDTSGKYVFLSLSGTTITPSAITQNISDMHVVSSHANICVLKNNSSDNRYSIIYKYSNGIKIIVGTIDTNAQTFTAVNTTAFSNSGMQFGQSLGISVVKTKEDTFMISNVASLYAFGLVKINTDGTASVLAYGNASASFIAYNYYASSNLGVYNQYLEQIAYHATITTLGTTFSIYMVSSKNNKVIVSIQPAVVKTAYQPPSDFINVVSGSISAYGVPTIPLSDNRVITIAGKGSSNIAYTVSQYKNKKWSVLAEGTFSVGISVSYILAWGLSGDRILIADQSSGFTAISISSSNVITVGARVTQIAGYLYSGIQATNFRIVQLSDSLFVIKYHDSSTGLLRVFAVGISTLTITVGVAVSTTLTAPSESTMVKATATTAVLFGRPSGSYLYSWVLTVTGTTITPATVQYPNGTANLTIASFNPEYIADNVIAIQSVGTTAGSYMNVTKYTVTSAAITSTGSLFSNTITSTVLISYRIAYIPEKKKLFIAHGAAGTTYYDTILDLNPITYTADATLTTLTPIAPTYYSLHGNDNFSKQYVAKDNYIYFNDLPSGAYKNRIRGNLKTGLLELIYEDMGNALGLISDSYPYIYTSGFGLLTDGTLFAWYTPYDSSFIRLGCPEVPDSIIGVATSTASKYGNVKVKGFGFGYDNYGGA